MQTVLYIIADKKTPNHFSPDGRMNQNDPLLKKMYSYLWKTLFCPETGLFYDRISDGNDRFRDLPSLEEIAKQFPNPCGWSTGMEDCSINGGHMLLTLAQIHRLTGEDLSEKISALLSGVCLCETIHGNRGFLVRGVSHRDGKSCYFNSSRDQLTMMTGGLFELYRSVPFLAEPQRELIRNMLLEMAQYCRKSVTEKNHYSYLRLDGGRAIVSDLWACDVHEMLRLPMIYAAAGVVCEDGLFRREAAALMEEGLRVSEMFDKDKYYWDFPLIQMQLSLDVLRKCDFLAPYHKRLDLLREKVGFVAHREFCKVLERSRNYTGDWNVFCPNWRTLPMKMTAMTLKEDPCNGVFDGYTYLNPVYPQEFGVIVEYLRSLGNYLTAALLAGNSSCVKKEDWKDYCGFLETLEFEKCTHAGPFSLLHGYVLGMEYFGKE